MDPLLRRDIDARALAPLPGEDEANDESYFQGNRDYQDLRGMTWEDVAGALEQEERLIARLRRSTDPHDELEQIEEHRLQEDELFGLDLGVGSAVLALSALGGAPFFSCNGGAFGGQHAQTHPLVVSYMPAESVAAALGAAREAGVGMVLDDWGRVQLYATAVDPMIKFARLTLAKALDKDETG